VLEVLETLAVVVQGRFYILAQKNYPHPLHIQSLSAQVRRKMQKTQYLQQQETHNLDHSQPRLVGVLVEQSELRVVVRVLEHMTLVVEEISAEHLRSQQQA
jgi:hypothetical protein